MTKAYTDLKKPLVQPEPTRGPHRMLPSTTFNDNQASQALLRDGTLHAKLEIGGADDPEERRADAIADRVVQGGIAHAPSSGHLGALRSKRDASATSSPPQARAEHLVRAATSGGEPLSPRLRGFFEPRMQSDFSAVRIHRGAQADASTRVLGARAYAIGQHVVFGAGQFTPDTTEGRRLIAHELAHVAAGTPPDRIQRDTPASKPYAGPAPANPFQTAGSDDKVDLTQLVITSMQALTGITIDHAYTNYLSAVDRVRAILQTQKREAEEKEKATRELVLGAVLIPLGLAAPAVAVAAMNSIPGLRNTLIKRIETTLPSILPDSKGAKAVSWATTAIDEKIAKVDAEKIGGAVVALGEKMKGAAASVTVSGGPFDQAMAFLDACAFAADVNSKTLTEHVFVTSDFSALLGIYNTFSLASLQAYTIDLDGRAHHFMTQLSKTPGKVESLVEIDAYGRYRLAKVRYNTTSANYFFISWVTPDMEPIARQLEPTPTRLPTSWIVNHLPVPMQETGERIVIIDAWGKDRFALVMVEEGKTGEGRADEVTQYQFVRWFGPTEDLIANTKGAQQIGGINRLRPNQVKKLQAPIN